MALSKRKRRSVPRRIGEVNPPGIFSKAKCVFVSLTGSEYHHANRAQPDAATRTSSQSTRSAVDKASRRADQLEPVYCLLRTCAIPTHHALVPPQVSRLPRPHLPGRWATVARSAPGAAESGANAAKSSGYSAWTSLCEQVRMDRPVRLAKP